MDFLTDMGFRDGVMMAAYLLMFGIVSNLATKVRDLHIWHQPDTSGEHRTHCTANDLTDCLDKMTELEQQNQDLMREHRSEMVKLSSIQNQVLRSLDEILRRQWDDHSKS
jgi:arginine decarboxylase-like protein